MKFEDSINISDHRWRIIKGFMILVSQYLILRVVLTGNSEINVTGQMPKTFANFESTLMAFQELISEDNGLTKNGDKIQ